MAKTYTQQDIGKAIGGVIRERIAAFETQAQTMRTRELRKSTGAADVCPLCAEPDVGGHCACTKAHMAKSVDTMGMAGGGDLAMAEHDGTPKTKDCHSCGATKVGVRQDGALVTHNVAGKDHVCNGKRVIKTDTDPSTLLFEDKEPKVLHPSDRKAKKPKTPQVGALPGMSPLGVKKDELSDDKKAAGVGPVNALMSKLKKPAPAAPDTSKGPIKGSRGMGAAGMAALARGEKSPGAKLPGAGKPVKISKPGSGGELRKDTMGALIGKDKFKAPGSMGAPKLPGMPPKAPGVVGVSGKQPVGQGGGDAKLGAPGMHPETAAGLADVKGLAPAPAAAGKWKAQGLPNLKSKLGDVAAAKIPITEAPVQAKAPASNPAADLAADKKAAGVGFLNALFAKFRKPAPEAPIGTGPVRSQASPYAGVRGMAALARAEACGVNLLKSLGNCALCGTSEHLGRCPR